MKLDGKILSPHEVQSRRQLLGSVGLWAATVAASPLHGQTTAAQRDWSGNSPVRYPDPSVVSLDKQFDKYRLTASAVERVATGFRWAEGPAWNGAGNYLVWSDIPNNRQMRWLEEDGHVSQFRSPSNFSNGNTFDWQGRQISCEHQARRVVRYEQTGKVTVLASTYSGKQFNAPNDVVVHPDGDIWFTDPGYGALMTYEGGKFPMELKEAVYRIDGKTGAIEKVTDELAKPNGLCFSPDFKKLYIADTGATHYSDARREIRVYDVNGTRLTNSKTFFETKWHAETNYAGLADGIRADVDGNIWAAIGQGGDWGDGVYAISPAGQKIGRIVLPEICANICFGGTRRNRLFMTASQSLYALYVEAQGANIS
jgi:gluconolactonase